MKPTRSQVRPGAGNRDQRPRPCALGAIGTPGCSLIRVGKETDPDLTALALADFFGDN